MHYLSKAAKDMNTSFACFTCIYGCAFTYAYFYCMGLYNTSLPKSNINTKECNIENLIFKLLYKITKIQYSMK